MRLRNRVRIENNIKIFISSLIFVFAFMVVLIPFVSKGTQSLETEEEKIDSLNLICSEVASDSENVECEISLDSISMVTQGLVMKYVFSEGIEYVDFVTDSFEIESSDEDGTVLVNLDGVSGEGIIVGKLKLKMPSDVIPDTKYKIELVDSTIGDGEDTVIELEDTFDEIRIKSDVNTLDSITLSDGVLNEVFDRENLKYTATTNSEKIIISAEATSEYATISGDVDIEKELHYGTNVLSVVVTSEDGNEKIYEISIFRTYEFNTTAYLYDKINNYIYVGNDIDNLLDNIDVDDVLETRLDKENELLIISYENEIILQIDLLSISFKDYILSNNTLYADKELVLDDILSDIIASDVLEFDLADNKFIVRYIDTILSTYDVVIYSLSFDDNLNVDEENSFINNLTLGTIVSELLDKVNVVGGTVYIYSNSDNKKSSDSIIATGDILRVYLEDNLMSEYQLSVLGDSNGDGKLSVSDLSQFRKHFVDWIDPKTGIEFELTGVYSNSFDLNKDGRISAADLSLMRKKIAGVEE